MSQMPHGPDHKVLVDEPEDERELGDHIPVPLVRRIRL